MNGFFSIHYCIVQPLTYDISYKKNRQIIQVNRKEFLKRQEKAKYYFCPMVFSID